MKFIREVETKRDKYGRMVKYSEFECPICKKNVVKMHAIGLKNKGCSRECGEVSKQETIAKRTPKMKKKKKTKYTSDVMYSVVKIPTECKGCGYWQNSSGCNYSIIEGRSRMLMLNGRSCREAGIYTTQAKRDTNAITIVGGWFK